MAGSLVTRWRTRRAERRELMLERLGGRQIERGGAPIAGGYGVKFVALAVLVAIFVGAGLLMKMVLDGLS